MHRQSCCKTVQPITRDLEHMFPYQQTAGFLTSARYLIAFRIIPTEILQHDTLPAAFPKLLLQ